MYSAFGFWCFPFVLLWGISGFYFAFAQAFAIFFVLDPADRITDRWLFWLSELHFGRFTRLTEEFWLVLGLVPGILAFTVYLLPKGDILKSLRIPTASFLPQVALSIRLQT